MKLSTLFEYEEHQVQLVKSLLEQVFDIKRYRWATFDSQGVTIKQWKVEMQNENSKLWVVLHADAGGMTNLFHLIISNDISKEDALGGEHLLSMADENGQAQIAKLMNERLLQKNKKVMEKVMKFKRSLRPHLAHMVNQIMEVGFIDGKWGQFDDVKIENLSNLPKPINGVTVDLQFRLK